MPAVTGTLVDLVEQPVAAVLAELGRCTLAVHDPPWSSVRAGLPSGLPAPARVVVAGDVDLDALEAVAAVPDDGEVVVGLGGGTALDTAKFLAWRTGRPLVQIPSITSVDAAFTDAVGVRVAGRVRYVGKVLPRFVALDVALVRSAPPSLNRAGIGDVLSCHTGLWDWRAAAAAGHGHPWDDGLAALGASLLDELDAAVDDVAAVSAEGIRFLAGAYRRIGAACAAAGHSRFEEGAEHFWAYAYEHATGAHHVHGELIALGVVAAATLQDNDVERATRIVAASGCRAHPADLGIDEATLRATLAAAPAYARAEGLDVSVLDLRPLDEAAIDAAWAAVDALPRRPR